MLTAAEPRWIELRNTPRRSGVGRRFGQRAPVEVLVREHHVHRFDGNVQEVLVVDLDALAKHVHQHLAPAGDGDDVAGLQHGIGRDLDDCAAAAEALDEDPLARQRGPARPGRRVMPTALPPSRTR